jgi:hypothetical protein
LGGASLTRSSAFSIGFQESGLSFANALALGASALALGANAPGARALAQRPQITPKARSE